MRQLLLTLMLAFGLSVFATNPNTLRLVLISGQELLFHVDGEPELTVNGTTVTVSVSNQDEPDIFEIENISHVDFVNDTGDAVNELSAEPPMQISRQGRILRVAGLPDDSDIRVFSIDGRQVIVLNADREAEIDFSQLPAAFYIVKINQVTIKTRI